MEHESVFLYCYMLLHCNIHYINIHYIIIHITSLKLMLLLLTFSLILSLSSLFK